MRDAIVASVTLDIFNKHSERVVMANLAQTVNVLQAVVLTDGEKMVLTPTYHVFDLFKGHHDATLLGHWLEPGETGNENTKLPQLSLTASEKDGKIVLTITNISAVKSAEIKCSIPDIDCTNIKGRILTGAIDALNDFTNVNNVSIKPFKDVKGTTGEFECTLPPCAVAELVI